MVCVLRYFTIANLRIIFGNEKNERQKDFSLLLCNTLNVK